MRVPFGEWAPDRVDVDSGVLADLANMIPTAEGYDSYPATSQITSVDPLSGPCRGADRGRMNEQDYLVAATEDTLSLSVGGGAWVDTVVTAIVPDTRWKFDQYTTKTPLTRKDLILATAGGGASYPPYFADLGPSGSTTFAALSADASSGKVAGVVRDFYVLGDIEGRGANSAIGREESGIHWCAVGNPESWPVVGSAAAATALSDIQVFPGDGGPVTAIVQAGDYALVFRRRQVWRMDYVGAPSVFEFRLIDDHRGCIAPNAAVAVGSFVYFPSEEGFLVCNGATTSNIGLEKIDREWRRNVNLDALFNSSVAHDGGTRMIFWAIPDQGGVIPVKILGYQYGVQRWTKLELGAECILSAFTGAASNMDIPSASGGQGDLDLDNPVLPDLGAVNMDSLTGEQTDEVLAVFRTNHVLYTFTASTMLPGRIETQSFSDPSSPRLLVSNVRPIMSNNGDSEVVVLQVGSGLSSNEVTFPATKFASPNRIGVIPYRASGRYLRARFYTAGDIRQFQGFDATVSPRGMR